MDAEAAKLIGAGLAAIGMRPSLRRRLACKGRIGLAASAVAGLATLLCSANFCNVVATAKHG